MHNTTNGYTRRQFLSTASLLTGSFILPGKWLFAQGDSPVTMIIGEASKSPVTVQKLRDNFYVLEGSGGNILLLTGKEGNLLVDAGIDVSKEKIKLKIQELNPQPLRYLINTHWHFDHTSGNEWLHKEGARIIAQENTKKWLSRTTRVDDWNYTFPAAPASAIPAQTFQQEHTLTFNQQDIHLHRYAPAHTDSDISVYFPQADLLHVGDTWWNGYYPFIDYNTGGGIKGMVKAAEQNVAKATAKTIVVPGHGPVGKKADLIAYRDMLADIEQTIEKLKKAGRTEKEVIAAKPTKKYDQQWGNFVIGPDFFSRLVYKGV